MRFASVVIFMMSLTPLCAAPALAQAQAAAPTPSTAQGRNVPIRFLDVTERNDGWVLAQSLGVSGSSEHKIAIISYMDLAMTRAFYDIAVSFTQAPNPLPIFGVVRAAQHPTEPNQNGFDIYINGVPLGEIKDEVLQRVYSKPALLRALLENIQKDDRR
jgi:hypothetical protein